MQDNNIRMHNRRSVIRQGAVATTALAMGRLPKAFAAGPANVTIVVGASPGTGVDILSRTIGQQLGARFGTNTVVDNKPGASGNIAADLVAKAKPDGATLFIAATTFATNAAVNQSLPYDPVKDFVPIMLLGTGSLCLVVPANHPANTLAEFVAAAKGPTAVNYGSPGNGTPQHLSMELFRQEAGINVFHVPFRASGNAVNDLAGGHVSAMITPVHTVMGLVKGGKLKMLAVMSAERLAAMPQVPTFREQGYPKVQVDVWYGLFAPKGTPAAVVQSFNQDINQILKTPDIVAGLARQGIDAQGGTPARMAEVLGNELKRWPPVVRVAQIKAN